MYNTESYITKTFNDKKPYIATATGYVKPDGTININMSSIYDVLIKNTGHWCEHYASDILCDIEEIKKVITDNDTKQAIIVSAIRESGVDSNCIMADRLSMEKVPFTTINDYYRKIFGVKIIKKKDEIWCGIKEIDKGKLGLEYTAWKGEQKCTNTNI